MTEPRSVGERIAAIFDPDEGGVASAPEPTPLIVTICALCHQRVTVDQGTHRVIDSRVGTRPSRAVSGGVDAWGGGGGIRMSSCI